jgi:excisionase family DNA binding protein
VEVSRLIFEKGDQNEYLISPEELRQFLGLGRTYTYQLLASGAIPSVRIGRLRKVRRAEVEQFIDTRMESGGGGCDE